SPKRKETRIDRHAIGSRTENLCFLDESWGGAGDTGSAIVRTDMKPLGMRRQPFDQNIRSADDRSGNSEERQKIEMANRTIIVGPVNLRAQIRNGCTSHPNRDADKRHDRNRSQTNGK